MAKADSTVEYREIPGFPGYRVGSDGSVWSHRQGKCQQLKPVAHRDGHLRVLLAGHQPRRQRLVHRLVAAAFIGPCPPGMECCHNDGNPVNNVPANLRYDTRLGNASDQIRHGTRIIGERNGRAKLTEKDVLAIRRVFAAGAIRYEAVGRQYGVTGAMIRYVVRGQSWKHLTDSVKDSRDDQTRA